MNIEAILFDLGKVLVDFDMDTAVRSMMVHCAGSRDDFEKVLWNKAWIRGYERGEISTEAFHQYLCDSGALDMDLAQFCDTWSSIFRPDPIVSEDFLTALRRKYQLILVSNTNPGHAEFIRRNYNIFPQFEHLILSYEVGSLKPDRKIFEHAIAVSGKPPDKLFFTDDREENVLAARQLGLHAHQFTSLANLVDALRDVGVDLVE